MKIAVCYRGDYYRETIHTWVKADEPRKRIDEKKWGSNYFCNYKNHLTKLFEFLPNYDVFFHTYTNGVEMDKKLIERLTPTRYKIENERHPKISHSVMETIKLVDTNEYDFIINIRFDLWFLKPIVDFNLDFDKFNYTWRGPRTWWKRRKFTDDLMFAFSSKYKDAFTESVKKRDRRCRKKGSVHLTYEVLSDKIGSENINFMIDGNFDSYNGKDEIPKNGHLMINRNYDELKI